MNNTTVIQMTNVSKRYHRGAEEVHAVDNANLTITAGEYVAIVGPSGSGKTTLMNIIGCLDHPTGGIVAVNGHEIQAASEKELTRVRQRSIGFVFQQFFLIPTLTVLENVEIPTLFAHTKPGNRARELLELVGLGKRLDHLPGQLSGGEMQRVAIARSLINKPPILLADEPTGNLDSRNAGTIMSLFQELNNQSITIVVVTHNPDLVKCCARTVHIEDGKLKM